MKRFWTTTRMWDGQPCAVLASGESMNADVVAAVYAHFPIRVIAVNCTHELAPLADLLYAADASWWNVHHAATKRFIGLKACAEETHFDDVLRIKDSGKEGFDPDPAAIRGGGNSGYAAIHLAAHLGCRKIVLCGFDMRGGNWHGKHKQPLRTRGEGRYAQWIPRFSTLAPELAKRGIEVINATPGSALKCFPQMELGAAFAPRALAA